MQKGSMNPTNGVSPVCLPEELFHPPLLTHHHLHHQPDLILSRDLPSININLRWSFSLCVCLPGRWLFLPVFSSAI